MTTRRVGVLVVHGIGEQKRGETLVRLADSLARFLERWLEIGVGDGWTLMS